MIEVMFLTPFMKGILQRDWRCHWSACHLAFVSNSGVGTGVTHPVSDIICSISDRNLHHESFSKNEVILVTVYPSKCCGMLIVTEIVTDSCNDYTAHLKYTEKNACMEDNCPPSDISNGISGICLKVTKETYTTQVMGLTIVWLCRFRCWLGTMVAADGIGFRCSLLITVRC